MSHLYLRPAGPVLPRVLRPSVVQDPHHRRVKLLAAGLVARPSLHPPRSSDLGNVGLNKVNTNSLGSPNDLYLRGDIGNVGLNEVSRGNGSLPQPPEEIIK